MRLNTRIRALTLIALAPLAHAVPDADGNLVSPDALPNLSEDAAMSARLNYNMGFEKFESAMKLESGKGSQSAMRQAFVEAREKFRKATEADPTMKEAWNMVGYTSRRVGDYDESLKAYDTALKLAPDYPEATEYLAELYLLTGRFEDVKASFARLVNMSPSYAGVLLDSSRKWLKSPTGPGASVTGAERDAFAKWVAAQKAPK